MTFLDILEICNYVLILIFGLLLSVGMAGGWGSRREKRLIFLLGLGFLLVQGICWLQWGTAAVQQLYPLIVHLPLTLILVFGLKKRLQMALVSVCIAYLCCQLPRWVSLMVTGLTGSVLVGEIAYTLSVVPIFFVLHWRFVKIAHGVMADSPQALMLFGSLPAAYYLFDYATNVYAAILWPDPVVLNEFLPTAVILFYVFFLAVYHAMTQKHARAELQSSMLEAELKQAHLEMESLRQAETQAAIYQHNMCHHLNAIEGYLATEKPQQARAYIQKVQADVRAILPRQFCRNELVNLLCSSFTEKAGRLQVRLNVEAKLPETLAVSDTELCALLSNGLENAIRAAAQTQERWVELYCTVRRNKLLLEIRNPYVGEVILAEGRPVSSQDGHGYGCQSIQTITAQYRGLCSFEPENGIFTLRVALPLPQSSGR